MEFRLGRIERVVEGLPAGSRLDVVDEAGYHFLAAVHRARSSALARRFRAR